MGSQAELSAANTVNPSFLADRAGSYVAQLIVNDGTVNSAPDTVAISTANSRPVANAGPDLTAAVGDTVVLDGRGSLDADGNPLSYQWSLLNNPPDSTAALAGATTDIATLVPDVAGLYVVQLIVSNCKLITHQSLCDFRV